MAKSKEFQKFDQTMNMILRADPKAVKAAMETEIREHAAERKAKGERKRGRKPKTTLASDRASGDRS